ncbi:NAD(P)/FAD-dependent oxidoreductase [Croceicoccus marinus]|uniref:FAD-binding oxidoreductase n=1 Tax=Croceicoccus marinus TaxID=450378 RepID=A0A7G6VT29_9SPHN|nr:FAD-dependent oxidoreductase [Croceicoccus marinus]QNE04894.1 FAD-binding oxidoreductase [Croceicoccus marinus]
MEDSCDIAIIGAGMAGASLAASLVGSGVGRGAGQGADEPSVVLLEAEDAPGYHATGRSAAFWEETYGGPEIFPLTAASGPFLRDGGFLTQRGVLYIGRQRDKGAIDAFIGQFRALGARIERLGRDRLATLVPGLRPEWVLGTWSEACADIDVAALHAHFLAEARAGGARLRTRARLVAARREAGEWRLALADGETVRARVIVNAAGAWADEVARMAGARPIGIAPLRRTVVQLRCQPPAPADLPLVLDIGGTFYFKPENGRLWLSPHDETPSPACDAAPDEIDVALAVERLEQAVDWNVEAVERKWAGLRSFAPDRAPVYGFDPRVPGFFWCAGQGGFGIQTSPAAADMAASMLLGRDPVGPGRGVDPAPFSAARF